MDIFGILSLLGGLALFLFGMDTMGDGLVKLSGGKLEKILERLTTNRLAALFTGVAVTAIIQSSSATTVMVVGFVNSGIMQLQQAVGIIMGANIGTTVTSWLLSLTGIQGNNLFIKMLKPSSFSPVLAAIGVVLTMMKSDGSKKKDIGSILLGFAVLMYGMEAMSGAVEPLADNEGFTNLLIKFSNPLLGLVAGTLLTAIIQSSSASVGILQALCATGVVGYGTAIPIIMGQNIGTCITALLSSIGANKNARRASMIHLYFNLIGTAIFMIAFYSIHKFVDFTFLNTSANVAGIAVIHSIFNIACTIILFPFANWLVKLATLTVKDKSEKEESKLPMRLQALDERFLETPTFAVNLCNDAVVEMANIAGKTFKKAIDVIQKFDSDNVKIVKENEELLDIYDDYIGSYIVKLSGTSLTTADSYRISLLMHCINDFERISDHSRNIVETAEALSEKGLNFSKDGIHDIVLYSKALRDIIDMTIDSFINGDIEQAKNVEPLEEVIDTMCKEMKDRHITRLSKGNCSYETSMYFEDLVTDYERVSDHCSNIAVSMIEGGKGQFDTHTYLSNNAVDNSEWFTTKINEYAEKYALTKA